MSKRIHELTAAGALTGAEPAEISQLSASVTITASTISFAAADNSINDSGGGLIAAGFVAGKSIHVTGAVAGANNLHSGRITIAGLTAGKMIIAAPEGDAIVDGAAGPSITITQWESWRTTLQDIADLAGGGGGAGSPIIYTIDTGSTADADPGNGLLTFNNATQSAATMLYIDNATADAVTLTTYLASLAQTGFVSLVQSDDPSVWRIYKITAVTAASGYYKLTVVNQAGAGSFADNALVRLAFDSDASASGAVTGPGSSVDNTLPRFDGTGGTTLQGSGVIVDDDNKISGYRGNINTQTGTSYTLDAADTGKIVELSNAAAISLTLPATAAVGFACTLTQAGAGQVSFASTGSGTVHNRQSHTKLAGQWAMASAYVRTNSGGSAAEWVISGDTTT